VGYESLALGMLADLNQRAMDQHRQLMQETTMSRLLGVYKAVAGYRTFGTQEEAGEIPACRERLTTIQ